MVELGFVVAVMGLVIVMCGLLVDIVVYDLTMPEKARRAIMGTGLGFGIAG